MKSDHELSVKASASAPHGLPHCGLDWLQKEQARAGFVLVDFGGDVQIRTHTDGVGRGADEVSLCTTNVPDAAELMGSYYTDGRAYAPRTPTQHLVVLNHFAARVESTGACSGVRWVGGPIADLPRASKEEIGSTAWRNSMTWSRVSPGEFARTARPPDARPRPLLVDTAVKNPRPSLRHVSWKLLWSARPVVRRCRGQRSNECVGSVLLSRHPR